MKVIRPPSFSLSNLPPLIRELFQYRDLILTLSVHRLNIRYKQSLLGWAWALVQPLSLMLIYTAIFSVVARMPSDEAPYPLFVFAALVVWTFFSTVISNASTSLVSHHQLITKVYFPREILPATYVIAGIFDLLIASVVLAGLMAWYSVAPGWNALYAIPVLALGIAFAGSLALILSAAQVRFRDIGLAMPLLLQLWMFATPVVYGLSAVPVRFRSWYVLNPMAGIVENFRRTVILNQPPDMPSLLAASVLTGALLPISYLLFKHREAVMADII